MDFFCTEVAPGSRFFFEEVLSCCCYIMLGSRASEFIKHECFIDFLIRELQSSQVHDIVQFF